MPMETWCSQNISGASLQNSVAAFSQTTDTALKFALRSYSENFGGSGWLDFNFWVNLYFRLLIIFYN